MVNFTDIELKREYEYMLKIDAIKQREIVLFIMYFLVTFQLVIERYLDWFNYFDEWLSVIVFVIGIYAWYVKKKARIPRSFFGPLVILLVYNAFGTISSVIYEYQTVEISIAGWFLSIKWFLLFCGCFLLAISTDYEWFNGTTTFILIICVETWVLLSILLKNQVRGFYAWDLCAKGVFLIILLWSNKNSSKRIKFFGTIFIIPLFIVSHTGKGIAIAVMAVMLLLYVEIGGEFLSLGGVLVLGTILIAVARKDIYIYYIWGAVHGYARAVMLMTGLQIANDYFPLGTGWGSFGSYFAQINYSPVYYLYGVSEHRELGEKVRLFLNDAYLPVLLAETGWIGFICIMLLVFTLFLKIQQLYKYSVNIYGGLLLSLIYIGITFVEETGFQQPAIMCLAVYMGLSMGYCNRKCEQKYLQRVK